MGKVFLVFRTDYEDGGSFTTVLHVFDNAKSAENQVEILKSRLTKGEWCSFWVDEWEIEK